MGGIRCSDIPSSCKSIFTNVIDIDCCYSEYELMCKLVCATRELADKANLTDDEIVKIKDEIDKLNDLILNFDVEWVQKEVDKYIPSMILPEISDSGYFIINIPDTWSGVEFRTTELDYATECKDDYGHLVVLY